MCGIAGLLFGDGATVPEALVQAMNRAQAHRGPDGEGVLVEGAVGLGHRRLAILDPAGGTQPLSSPDGMVWLTYNGELYNHPELRIQLAGLGHSFTTSCDTETLLHAYLEWGDGCLGRLRGMFAFGIVDRRRRLVLLARDPFGIKPLVYFISGTMAAFASEIQALQVVPGFPKAIDVNAIDQFLRLQYIPSPLSAIEQVRKLPPAHLLHITFQGASDGPKPYWSLSPRLDRSRSAQDWQSAIGAAVTESVEAHLIADVPFGAFLSGGLDSTLVIGIMSRALKRPVDTFSIGFEDPAYDERAFARQAALRYGTRHHEAVVNEDILTVIPDMVRMHGEPFGDSSWLATQQVARLARRDVAMVLSGDGGDEAFAGYDSYRHWLEWLTYRGMPPWKRALRQALGLLGHPRWPRRRPTLANWMSFVQLTSRAQLDRLWLPRLRGRLHGRFAAFEQAAAAVQDLHPVSMARLIDTGTYLADDILSKVDHASMMHGLEVRTPLIDLRVVELAASMPPEFAVSGLERGAWQAKLPLKVLLAKDFPDSFTRRAKMGFSVPTERWLRPGGRLHLELDRRLQGDSPLWQLFDRSAALRLLADGQHRTTWLLLVLDEWLRQHPDLRT